MIKVQGWCIVLPSVFSGIGNGSQCIWASPLLQDFKQDFKQWSDQPCQLRTSPITSLGLGRPTAQSHCLIFNVTGYTSCASRWLFSTACLQILFSHCLLGLVVSKTGLDLRTITVRFLGGRVMFIMSCLEDSYGISWSSLLKLRGLQHMLHSFPAHHNA